ncbi:hypothetical protein BG015_003067 [Linnemannia schmuckeri]|uniref:Heparan-alpha-glucosaminide N-acetyltransferase catalytic domain-containing protein n=1 Tax=Linnemannia schmuckeri TaxID=64567 RepID=A0A9P5RN03_9FUNG|nr:hypothetical protein BG015_003067 [Linnemannia schmuckeri]
MEKQHTPVTAGADTHHPHRDDNNSSSSNHKIDDPQVLSPISANTAVHKDAALPALPEPAHDAVAARAPRAGGLKSRLQLSANRLLSLDLLRGLAILIMITCNAQMGDNAFWILTHPAWIGITIADTVFPSFLFITGCTLPLSVRADPNPTLGNNYYRNHALRILKRSIIIWGLGIILNLYGLVQLHAPADQFRWPGVLNRIGFCYLIVGWMHLLVLAKGRKDERPLSVSYLFRSNKAADTVDGGRRVEEEVVEHGAWPWFVRVTLPFYLPVVCLVVWLICTYSVQVEGCPYRAMIEDPKCSPQAYFDLKIFGKDHTYRHLEFDPEGSLSTLTSILNVWFGWYIGCTVRTLNAQIKQITSDFKAHREASASSGTVVSEAQVLEDDILEQETLTALAVLFYKFDAQPKAKRLERLHRDHQVYLSNNQLSHHHRPLPLDSEHTTSSTDRGNYSSALALYFKADHFLRHWFRRSVIVVLGSMGRNAILMYMCSELVQGTCSLIPGGPADPVTGEKSPDLCTSAFQHTWGALDIGGWASLFYSLGFAALHVLLAIFLDHKKWYFKV